MGRTHFQVFNRLDEDETEITVEYSFSPGAPATWDDPAEGPEIEIIGAWTSDSAAWIDDGTGKCATITLTDDECKKFQKWIAENHEDDDEPDYDERD